MAAVAATDRPVHELTCGLQYQQQSY